MTNADELQRRRELYERLEALRAYHPETSEAFPTVDEMIREDRER